MMDTYFEMGALDLPIMILPIPVTGTTGPASLFSNICIANTEAISLIIIYQLAHPGRPMIYSSATGTMDMRNGAYVAEDVSQKLDEILVRADKELGE
jgi:trimethylamine---corrinoid protein Co-methyltransferase